MTRKPDPIFWPECRAPHPTHRSGMCECGPADGIHGPWEECEEREGEECPNPSAHHAFVPPIDEPATLKA